MKKLYTLLLNTLFITLLLLNTPKTYAQCTSGPQPTAKAFDTTVTTGSGNYESFFTFPKFPPDSGMVSCVKLTLKITGVIERMYFENNSTSSNDYSAIYDRKDSISGLGISGSMNNSVVKNYGPYTLAPKIAPFNGGADYKEILNDTVLNSYTVTTTISDAAEISKFYGLDSITYRYAIKASTTPTGPGDFSFGVSTVGFVNYKLEYCYCPPTVLPLGLGNFNAVKENGNSALLSWQSETDKTDYLYEIQVSRDGKTFSTIAIVQKQAGINPAYQYRYEVPAQQSGQVYFRVKQRYPNGYTRYTSIKNIGFENQMLSKVSLYPNPSSGIVGIKFVNISAGKINVQVSNVHGQTVVNREFAVSGTDYKQVAALQKGMYWMKITDVSSQQTVVNQVLIK